MSYDLVDGLIVYSTYYLLPWQYSIVPSPLRRGHYHPIPAPFIQP